MLVMALLQIYSCILGDRILKMLGIWQYDTVPLKRLFLVTVAL